MQRIDRPAPNSTDESKVRLLFRILVTGAVMTGLAYSGGPFFPLMLLGSFVTGVLAARRGHGWRGPAAAWAVGGFGMLVFEWIINNEDQTFVVVLTFVMVGLVRIGHAVGSIHLRQRKWETRWIGVLGAVLLLVGQLMLGSVPGGGEVESAEFQQFYVTDDRAGTAVLGLFAITFGTLGLLWFLWELHTRIGTALAAMGFASGASGLVLVVVGTALLLAPSAVQVFGGAEFVGEPVAHTMAQAGWGVILVGAALFLGLSIASFSAAARRSGSLRSGVTVFGFVAAGLQLVAFVWIPSLAIPAWFLLAATTGVRADCTTGGASETGGAPRPEITTSRMEAHDGHEKAAHR